MDTISMNSENGKPSKAHFLILKFTDKLYLWTGEKTLIYQILVFIYYIWYIKSSYNSDKFKMSAPTWNDKFELTDESYSVSDIQDYFENILKNMEKVLMNRR